MIATVGLQAYNLDWYPEGSGEVAAWMNFGRTTGSFTMSYSQVTWANTVGTEASRLRFASSFSSWSICRSWEAVKEEGWASRQIEKHRCCHVRIDVDGLRPSGPAMHCLLSKIRRLSHQDHRVATLNSCTGCWLLAILTLPQAREHRDESSMSISISELRFKPQLFTNPVEFPFAQLDHSTCISKFLFRFTCAFETESHGMKLR